MGERNYYFERLTPTDNADLNVYEDAINYVFESSDIKNVAISGSYSSGKSSIIASYKKKHKDLRFMHISLAHFVSTEQEDGIEIKESILEGKILNQLIHQIPSDKIPQTNFRVKKNISSRTIFKNTVVILLFILMIIFFACFNTWENYVQSLADSWLSRILTVSTNKYALLIDGLSIAALLFFVIYDIIKIQKNKNVFRKLSIQGNEIEIFEESDESYFDKYLNEVLYLFEHADADVIVFEDMDRFNLYEIFERLREVNTLINIQLQKEKKGVIRFFYLLRDDIFVSKDRTKFFDYIIPIVPVVDSSNSYDQFIAHFKKSELYDFFNENFLQGLSIYIDDMRLLKNIYNEFIIYFYKLNTTELDCNKMLAIIAYKNLFPRDFSDLQLNKGFVHAIFESKDSFVEEEINRIDDKINKKQQAIDSVRTNHLTALSELNAIFAFKYLPECWRYNWSDAQLQSELLRRLQGNSLNEYKNRKQQLEELLNIDIAQCEADIDSYHKEQVSIKSKQLKEIITRDNIEDIFSITSTNEIGDVKDYDDVKCSEYFDLLKYLIRNGYIDETYADYMSYFYENSLSRIDKTFLRSITDKKAKECTYHLSNPKLVISRLNTIDFKQEETLNYDLLEYLLLNHDNSENNEYLELLISQLQDGKCFEFVSGFLNQGTSNRQFVSSINNQWHDFFSLVMQLNAMPSMQIREFSIDTLCCCDDTIITAVNVDNCLTDYISSCRDYLVIENPDAEKLISSFLLLDVSFTSIDYEKSNNNLFQKVYNNSLYKLSFENISLMLKIQYGITDELDISHKNYTLIQSQSDSPLAEYISINMAEYVSIILLNCNGEITDSDEFAIRLLNCDDISIEERNRYITKLSTTISVISEVSNPFLWTEMLHKKIVTFSVRNFTDYFLNHGVDEELVNFINENSKENFKQLSSEYSDDVSVKIFDAVIKCNAIATDRYVSMLTDLEYTFDNYDALDIESEKFDALIDAKIMPMDIETLQFIRKNYSEQLNHYIQANLDEYLALQTPQIAQLDEVISVISWSIDDDKKIQLVSNVDGQISVINKHYSDAVTAHIVTHNLFDEDKNTLYAQYELYGESTKNAIMSVAIEQITEIIDNSMCISDLLLSALFKSDSVTRSQKINLFIASIPQFNEETCKNHFDELGLSDLKEIFTKASGRRNYEKNDDITNVLEGLKANSWIYDYYDDERNDSKYVIIKNKPRNK